jgi:hypothetical protein
MSVWERIGRKRLADIAQSLSLPRTASKGTVLHAIDQLSDPVRRRSLRATVEGLSLS